MCGIVGAVGITPSTQAGIKQVEDNLLWIFEQSRKRGRDGFGCVTQCGDGFVHAQKSPTGDNFKPAFKLESGRPLRMIANFRAEPTTEFVEDKGWNDQQPYNMGDWQMVHNGTIANDKELRQDNLEVYPSPIDSAAIVEELYKQGDIDIHAAFNMAVDKLVGSYAILAFKKDDHTLYGACNYRPLWHIEHDGIIYFASAKQYLMFPGTINDPAMIPPYSRFHVFQHQRWHTRPKLIADSVNQQASKRYPRTLVVASGGMDSTTAAAMLQKEGHDITLLHLDYGCKASKREWEAVRQICMRLSVPRAVLPMPSFASALTSTGATIAEGETGAEFAHEWVPARNLLMLAMATAFAECEGYDYIALGNNMEEAGAYPDNEPEFINRFNEVLPFAVADGKRVRVLMPVGNLMKHEVVAKGLEIGAPLDVTWSCYHDGRNHCGQCGPCYMRKKAFKINNAEEQDLTYGND